METIMDIGDRLRKVRTQQELTAKQLSELSGVPEKTIYRIETGEVKDPRLSSIEPLIKALNCSADELLFDKDDFTSLERLRQEFAHATKLDDDNLDLLLELIRKFNLATSFEQHIGKEFAAGNVKPLTTKKKTSG